MGFSDGVSDEPVGAPGGKSASGAATRTAPAADSPSAAAADGQDGRDDPGPWPQGAEAPEGDGGADEPSHQQVERDLDELTAQAEKAAEYLRLAQRTKADFENYKKRASREASLAQDRGIAKLAKELLPAIDNLDRAVQAAESFAAAGDEAPDTAEAEAESHLVSGIRLVHADVLAALARVGIEPFSPAGEPFDPQFHEAVAQHQVDGAEPGTVVDVYQQGYRLGETVLRPARVLVAA